MRTARCVIVCLLILSAVGCLHAQQSTPPSEGSVDTDLTVMGRDDGIIPIPEPGDIDEELVLPPLDTDPPDSLLVPPMLPPIADMSTLSADLAPPQAYLAPQAAVQSRSAAQ